MYDFDKVTDRRNTDCIKWDVRPDTLPMWIADMDFQTCPAVIESLKKQVEHGVFGYTLRPAAWSKAYADWWEKRHHFRMEEDWLLFCTSVVPIISAAMRRLTAPGEKVVLLSPVYNHFFMTIEDNGRVPSESLMRYENGAYSIDFEDLEKKLRDPAAAMMILCNPHNPTGMIWSREELAKIGALCAENGVVVVSDEIHCDITVPGTEYVPFASVDETCRENSITCIAPSKTFNIAGIHSAAACVPNRALREKLERALKVGEVAEGSVFSYRAAIAAFTEGGEWLDELCAYLAENRRIAEKFIAKELPQLYAVKGKATYLLWVDCGGLNAPAGEFADFLLEEEKLFLFGGESYRGDGNRFLRVNLACPRSILNEGLARLKRGTEKFLNR